MFDIFGGESECLPVIKHVVATLAPPPTEDAVTGFIAHLTHYGFNIAAALCVFYSQISLSPVYHNTSSISFSLHTIARFTLTHIS